MVELNAPDTRTVTCGQPEVRHTLRILDQAEIVDIAGNFSGYFLRVLLCLGEPKYKRISHATHFIRLFCHYTPP